MKKYLLNIDRLYAGQTANAILLKQVDQKFPSLVQSVTSDDFAPPNSTSSWLDRYAHLNGQVFKVKEKFPWLMDSNHSPSDDELNALNDYIVEYNLTQQQYFKEAGRDELYLMDDTTMGKPNPSQATVSSDKVHMHDLVGLNSSEDINASQLNVLFPFRKLSTKSMYAQQLTLTNTEHETDESLEQAMGVTLQGKVSYEDCLQGVATVGSNIYMMSPTIQLNKELNPRIFGNGLTIVNGCGEPYHFPHTLTLFQPSNQYDKGIVGENFKEWYRMHNRKTMVKLGGTYGSNVSELTCLGSGSYSIELATYAPTNLIVGETYTNDTNWIGFNSDTFRAIRAGKSDGNTYESGWYVLDNGDSSNSVGFMFNLYDNFITGDDRKLHIQIPSDSDFNNLSLKFQCGVVLDKGLVGSVEAVVCIGDEIFYEQTISPSNSQPTFQEIEFPLANTVIDSYDLTITVRMHYQVDFNRRNTTYEYRRSLMKSGLILRDIQIWNPHSSSNSSGNLTYAAYLNESGLSDDEWNKRYLEFWQVSKYIQNISYQTVVESSLNNMLTGGLTFRNNYATGDLYGDAFVTKSVLDSAYDMNVALNDDVGEFTFKTRKYIGLGQCSNQLSLLYRNATMTLPLDGESEANVKLDCDSELKYQLVEVVKNINRFESSIKHKSNVFSVVVENSNLSPDDTVDTTQDTPEAALERFKSRLRESVTQFVRNTCQNIVPVHTQLFDVQFR